jgi:citrate synthase
MGDFNSRDSLSVVDNRTGRSYELPISEGAVKASEFRQMKSDENDFGLLVYDPSFVNTASCRSAITYIDGDNGILEYRGYPIEQLARQSTFVETAYLLIHGELPTSPELEVWTNEIRIHTYIHEKMKMFMEGFQYDAHPMGMLLATVAAMSTFYRDAKNISDPESRQANRQDAHRCLVHLSA